MMRARAGLWAAIFFVAGGLAQADPSFEPRLQALEPAIGHYPADIRDKADAAAVKARYEALKRDLDKALAAHPGDEKLLAQRGRLQSMGHNFDYPRAWDGATRDLTAALRKAPDDVDALLALADLWVNSRPDLAGKAENLYRAAQCVVGDRPLEPAQRGLFFSFYYQGKVRDARRQADFLRRTWPDVALYRTLLDIAAKGSGGESAGGEGVSPEPAQVALTSCQEKTP
ncbi:hypothetical protein SAMN06265338_108140 [Rhodoblastus acidophilus]|uniref:Tetratricopeptide repeat protein n=1 Tax=Rhodoblastus acidophilus TaxID=1074 RepID=A0A212RXH3_RHOAC|nr:hypothetical protein [Rhodoblastus acidophilus]PPQ38433.1 hypothetical protein CKO16_10625 [Rhodoblastus acidophilus]RAI17261.1 hypothetical protein CH337_17200 [Rhodoblastus acidophilus]SNB77480.1 hypothetical protein SAMN06265338_108140 [Rhodoblastus acidophilus]